MASLAQPVEVAHDVAARLVAARVAHRDAQEVAERCARNFRRTVVEAKDAGITEKVISDLAEISRGRIHAIVERESRAP